MIDGIAFLKLAGDPSHEDSFDIAIKKLARIIKDSTIETIKHLADQHNGNYLEAIESYLSSTRRFSADRKALVEFSNLYTLVQSKIQAKVKRTYK